jgi:SAM-dependent methyltransferase
MIIKIINKTKKFIAYRVLWFFISKVKKGSKFQETNGIIQREYLSKNPYKSYINHQKFKFYIYNFLGAFDNQKIKIENFKINFSYLKLKFPNYQYTLCLGARSGAEVQAFRDLGYFSIGIDINYPKNSPYVLYGDFHKLDFPENCFDFVYSNCIDHVYNYELFLKEIKRVLKKEGRIIFDIHTGINEETHHNNVGGFETKGWLVTQDLINEFQKYGLFLDEKKKINTIMNQYIFKITK